MADVEKVKQGLRSCIEDTLFSCDTCGYYEHCYVKDEEIGEQIMKDALSVIEEQQAEIERLQPKKGKWIFTGQKNAYGGTVIQCPFCDDKYAVGSPGNEHYCRNCGAYFGGDDKDG